MSGPSPRLTLPVLGVPIDVIGIEEAARRLLRWAAARESRSVVICNVHSVVTAGRDDAFRAAVVGADLATADGAPVAWMLRRLGAPQQQRVSGPELMLEACALAAAAGQSIYLYGSTESTLQTLQQRLLQRWPSLQIAGAHAPPFRPLSAAEDEAVVQAINGSGAGLVWVSLGCPKQELWTAAHRGRVQAVMVGVGAAFDFHAGTVARAPRWMREHGLEWLFRLLREPRRLGPRYLVTNTAFMWGVLRQACSGRRPPAA